MTRLEEAGPEAAKDRLKEWMASPAPRIFYHLPFKTHIPVAVSEALQTAMKARSPLIVAYQDTIKTKVKDHVEVDIESIRLAQRIIDEGTMVDEGRGLARTYFARIDGKWWELVVLQSETGYLRIQTIHGSDARKAAGHIKRSQKKEEDGRRS